MIAALRRPSAPTWFSCLMLALLLLAAPAWAQEEPEDPIFAALQSLSWQEGPSSADLGGLAALQLPANYGFLGGDDSRVLLEAMQNLTSGAELGLVAAGEHDFMVIFEFEEIGYVKDDEKDDLDAPAMMKSMRESEKQANEERERRGWPTMFLTGWTREPFYDSATNNLEWAIEGTSGGSEFVNYNTRLLGRRGVMTVTLLVAPEQLDTILPIYKELLKGYAFSEGHRYAEWRKGDKVAAMGLTALVVGGATAVGLKSGLFAKFWKYILIGLAAIGAWVKKLMGGRSTQNKAVDPQD